MLKTCIHPNNSSFPGLQPELQSRIQPGQLQPELLQPVPRIQPELQPELQPDTCHWTDVQPPPATATAAAAAAGAGATATTAELQPAISAGRQ